MFCPWLPSSLKKEQEWEWTTPNSTSSDGWRPCAHAVSQSDGKDKFFVFSVISFECVWTMHLSSLTELFCRCCFISLTKHCWREFVSSLCNLALPTALFNEKRCCMKYAEKWGNEGQTGGSDYWHGVESALAAYAMIALGNGPHLRYVSPWANG